MDIIALVHPSHWQFWIAIGTVLAILEVIDGSFFLLCLGIGALLTAIPAALGVTDTAVILSVCAGIEVGVFMTIRPILARRLHVEETPSNVNALIGKTCVVTQPIDGEIKIGYVRVESEEWRAVTSPSNRLAVGEMARVEGISGATLTVTGQDTVPPTL
ncbi:MAG: NfeD family protein [Myxococcota bacterium]|nr:NfeD family protein [Myxococcota bacterium]